MPTVPLHHLEELVHSMTGRFDPLIAVEMPGGASTRRFYRVDLGGRTAVAMFVPEAGKPDEIAKVDENGRRWPFLEVQALLQESGVRVPRLLGEATQYGFIVVEDLGDDTLAAFLEKEPKRRKAVYRTAVRDLARAQRALADLPEASIVRARAFDVELLRWEVDHFREWGLEARGVELGSADREIFDRAAAHLAETIASWPRGFVHRDYQSRNLMVLEGERIAWLDFQDALLGPRVYDLVALLNDSYQIFEQSFVESRLDDYAEELDLGEKDRERLGREFAIVTVQRKLKDAGRFVFIDRKRGDSSYLRFVGPTIIKVRAALARLSDDPVLGELDALLARVCRVG